MKYLSFALNCKEIETKMKRKSISVETKMEILKRLSAGERQTRIGTDLDLSTSTIRTILKNKAKIETSATTTTPNSLSRVTRSRNNVFEEMEKQLSIWIDDGTKRNIRFSQAIIMEKAQSIFNHIQDKEGEKSQSFVASRGWFTRFKKRINLYNNQVTRRGTNSDQKVAALKMNIKENSEPVVNADQTSLRRKRMPKCGKKSLSPLVQLAKDPLRNSVSKDELKDLVEQKVDNNVNTKVAINGILSTNFLRKNLAIILKVMDKFVQNDKNLERSALARRNVIKAISSYEQLLEERLKKRQTRIDDFFFTTNKS